MSNTDNNMGIINLLKQSEGDLDCDFDNVNLLTDADYTEPAGIQVKSFDKSGFICEITLEPVDGHEEVYQLLCARDAGRLGFQARSLTDSNEAHLPDCARRRVLVEFATDMIIHNRREKWGF